MRALYVSHNGMLEGLGQSQVLPYLRGLARRGVQFDLFSYELPEAPDDAIASLHSSLERDGIQWTPLRRRRDPRLRVKVEEIGRGVMHSLTAAIARRPQIVHGRGYLPTAVGDVIATLLPHAKLLFDCRGMLGDEYVDSGYWTTKRPEYKLLKRYEARAFRRSEGVVVLTEALRRWVVDHRWLGPQTTIATIPCCVDLDKFQFDPEARQRVRRELGIDDDRLVLCYSGSLGGLYRLPDVARFVGIAKKRARSSRIAFLVLTPSPAEELVRLARESGLDEDEIIVRKISPSQMASHLSAADAGLAFGKTCFARMGCSPTKLAEYLACGLPLITNADFGDQGELATEKDTCVLVDSFEDDALANAADALLALANHPVAERVRVGRHVAEARFGLETVGVRRYETLYRAMVAPKARRSSSR